MTDLAELFARDPTQLTKDDLTTIVTELRSRRAQFTLGNQKAGTAKPSAKTKALEGLGVTLNLSNLLGSKL